MDLDQILDFAARLRESGLTLGVLAIAAAIFALTLIISTREVLHWYLGIRGLRKEVRRLSESIQRLEARINATGGKIHRMDFLEDPAEPENLKIPEPMKPQQNFPIQK
jgi:hypothetical protein